MPTMSLFGSVYEEPEAGPDASTLVDVPSGQPPGADDAGVPAPTAPSMSLVDFAAEVFGTRESPLADGEDASPFAALDGAVAADTDPAGAIVEEPPTGTAPVEPLEALEAAVGTVTPPAPPAEPVEAAPAVDPPFADDDVLPAYKPKRGSPLRGVRAIGGRHAAGAAVLVAALLSGFVGYRMVAGGSEESPERDQVANANEVLNGLAGGGTPGLADLGGALDATQLVSAEADLRMFGMQALAQYAEAGTFALTADEWSQWVGRPVVAGGGAPQPDVFSVLADDDAVCFETLTPGGTTVATGITPDAVGFASDPSGASACTADAPTLASWQPSLLGF